MPPSTTSHFSRRITTRSRIIIVTLAAFFLTIGIFLASIGFGPGSTTVEKILFSLLAAVLFLLPGRITYVVFRRHHRERRWSLTPSDEERRANLARYTKPSRASGLIGSPWFDVALISLYVVMFLSFASSRNYGPGHSRLILTLVFAAVIAQSVFSLASKFKHRKQA